MLVGTLSTYWTVDRYADPVGVSISRPSINLGKANNMPQGWDSVRYQFVDTLSHTIGRHDLKAGVDIQLDDQNTYFLGNKDGTFTFRTDAPFDPNDRSTYPFQYTQTIGDWYDPRKNQIYSGLRAGHLAGARSRSRSTSASATTPRRSSRRAKAVNVDQDLNNVAPRLGAIVDADRLTRARWCAAASASTTTRASTTSRATSATRPARRNVTVLNPGFPDPYAGGTIAATKPSLTDRGAAHRRRRRPGRSASARAASCCRVSRVSVDGVRTLGYDLFNALDINAPLPGHGRATGPRLPAHRAVPDDGTELDERAARVAGAPHRAAGRRSTCRTRSRKRSATSRTSASCRRTPTTPMRRRRSPATIGAISWWRPSVWRAAAGASRLPDCSRRAAACRGTSRPAATTTAIRASTIVRTSPSPDGDPTDKATYSSAFTGRVGNLGRNANTGPAFVQVDLRLSKFVRVRRTRSKGSSKRSTR